MSDHKTFDISELDIPHVEELNLDGFDNYESSLNFESPSTIRDILMQHFMAGEHDTFFEILALYMDHVGKDKVVTDTKIPKRTVYNFINGKHKTSSENVFKVMKFISDQVKHSA